MNFQNTCISEYKGHIAGLAILSFAGRLKMYVFCTIAGKMTVKKRFYATMSFIWMVHCKISNLTTF